MRYVHPKLLLLDQDDAVLRQVGRLFGGSFLVVPVRAPARAMGLLEADRNIRVIVTEQVMRAAQGIELLEAVRMRRPDVRRVLLTTYTDLASIVTGLHSGAVEAVVQKPAADLELLTAVCPEISRQAATAVLPHRASA